MAKKRRKSPPRSPKRPSETIVCQHCRRKFAIISPTHLVRIHGYDPEHPVEEYKRRFELDTAFSAASRHKQSDSKVAYWDDRGQHWTEELVLDAIRKFYAEHRKTAPPSRLSLAARRFYGSMRKAAKAAGVDYESVCLQPWTRRKVVAAIQSLNQANEPIGSTDLRRNHGALFQAIQKLFPGGLQNVLQAAGIDPHVHVEPGRLWTPSAAKKWVRTQHKAGNSVQAKDVPRHLFSFVRNHLGVAWSSYIESLGIPYPKKIRWTSEDVLSEIRSLAESGESLQYTSVRQKHRTLQSQAEKFFGSWGRACAAAGEKPV